jgi:hypothetical protein
VNLSVKRDVSKLRTHIVVRVKKRDGHSSQWPRACSNTFTQDWKKSLGICSPLAGSPGANSSVVGNNRGLGFRIIGSEPLISLDDSMKLRGNVARMVDVGNRTGFLVELLMSSTIVYDLQVGILLESDSDQYCD